MSRLPFEQITASLRPVGVSVSKLGTMAGLASVLVTLVPSFRARFLRTILTLASGCSGRGRLTMKKRLRNLTDHTPLGRSAHARDPPGVKPPRPARSLRHSGAGELARVGAEALGASLSEEVVRAALVLNARRGRGRVHRHTAYGISRLAGFFGHVVLPFLIASDLHHRVGGWYADVVWDGNGFEAAEPVGVGDH